MKKFIASSLEKLLGQHDKKAFERRSRTNLRRMPIFRTVSRLVLLFSSLSGTITTTTYTQPLTTEAPTAMNKDCLNRPSSFRRQVQLDYQSLSC